MIVLKAKPLPLPLDIIEEPTIVAWLNEFINERTRNTYKSNICKFFESTNLKPKDLQEMPVEDIKKIVLEFQRDRKKNGGNDNGTLSTLTAVRSYLVGLNKQLKFRKGQIVKTKADTDSHVFTNGDLKALWDVGGTFEKALLATAISEGWEVSSFLEQSKTKTEKRLAHAIQNNQKYIFFMDTREKTKEQRYCVLNPLAIECLTKYLETWEAKPLTIKNGIVVKDKDGNVVMDDRLFPITQDGVQKMLYRLAKDANLKTTGSLRFHNIRKWLMSRLSRCGFNEFQIKYIMGKSISVSDATYLQTLQTEVEEKYPVVYNDYLNINPTTANTSKELKKQSDDIKSLTNLIASMQKTIDTQAKDMQLLKATVVALQSIIKEPIDVESAEADEIEE